MLSRSRRHRRSWFAAGLRGRGCLHRRSRPCCTTRSPVLLQPQRQEFTRDVNAMARADGQAEDVGGRRTARAGTMGLREGGTPRSFRPVEVS